MKNKIVSNPFVAGDSANRSDEDNIRIILRLLTLFVTVVSVVIILLLLLLFPAASRFFACLNVLAVVSAYLLGGLALGFIFAIPKSAQGIISVTAPAPDAANGRSGVGMGPRQAAPEQYRDNTSLEEISDWITKIIVGLSLTQFNVIRGFIHDAAENIAFAFSQAYAPVGNGNTYSFYVFSYALVLLYSLSGLIIGYLWTRIDFPRILTRNKKNIRNIDRENELKTTIQLLANSVFPDGSSERSANTVEDVLAEQGRYNKEYNVRGAMAASPAEEEAPPFVVPPAPLAPVAAAPVMPPPAPASAVDVRNEEMRVLVGKILTKKPVKDKADLHKGRWGGLNVVAGIELKADVTLALVPGLFNVAIKLVKLDGSVFGGPVAVLLHDTFTPPVRILNAAGLKEVSLDVISYEAFTVAALVNVVSEDNYVPLELDLNTVAGYPQGFYWGK